MAALMSKSDCNPSRSLDAVIQFLRRRNTDFGFMLTGPWGSGKTHFWKNALKPQLESGSVWRDKKPAAIAYISLYGLDSLEQIETALLCQLHPALAKTGRFLSPLLHVALRWLKLDSLGVKINLEKWLTSLGDKSRLVICFDDLERAEIALPVLLGHMNQYIEHWGAKVIVLCNEQELVDRLSEESRRLYARAKEKVIRVTQSFELQVEQVVDQLIQDFSSSPPYVEYLRSHRDLILDQFRRSELNNLRILKFGLSVLENAYSVLNEISQSEREREDRLIQSLLPAAFESQAARVPMDDLRRFIAEGPTFVFVESMKDDSSSAGKESSVTAAFVNRYRMFENAHNLAKSDALADLLVHGYLDAARWKEEIRDENESKSPGQLAVRAVSESPYELSDDEFAAHTVAALKAIEAGEVSDWSSLIQVMRHFEYAIEKSVTDVTEEHVRRAFEEALRRLTSSGQFHRVSPIMALHQVHLWDTDRALVKWIRGRLVEENNRLAEKERKSAVTKAFETIGDGAIDFARLLRSDEGDGIANLPVAQYISAESFAGKAIETTNKARHHMAMGIRERYQNLREPALLRADVPRLTEVGNRLATWLEKNKELRRFSLLPMQQLHWCVNNSLENLRRQTG